MDEPPASIRIWVALDESPRSNAALTAAVALAEELDAELAGLFVEDIDLQHLAGLPFAREFSLLSGAGRPLSQGEMERTWRREAETLQRLLAKAAEPLSLRWSFRVARGRVPAEMSMLAQALDLIVLGKRTGFSVMAVARTPTRAAGVPLRVGPVLVLVENGSVAPHTLDLGARLARRNGAELVLLINAGHQDEFEAACAGVRAALKAGGVTGRCVRLTGINGARLIQAARRELASCLVLADKERFLTQAGFDRMLDELECPIVLT